jgi:hypothetical protein
MKLGKIFLVIFSLVILLPAQLTGSKTLTPKHVKALKELGFTFKQQTVPERIL